MRYEFLFLTLVFPALILISTPATVLGQQDSNQVASGQTAGPMALPDLAAKVKSSVVTILVYGEEGDQPSAVGTGWFIAPGQIVTNRHVIAGGKRVEIRLSTGIPVPVTGVLADDEDRDLALLSVEITDIPPQPLPLAEMGVREGDSVFVIYSSLDPGGTVLRGAIFSKQDIPNLGEFIQTTAAISADASGSPVLDMQGRVIGIATLQIVDGKSLSFAPTIGSVRALKPGPVRTLAGWSGGLPEDSAQKSACLLGLFYLIDKDYEKALAYYNQAAMEEPRDPKVSLSIGYCLFWLNRWEEAIQAYQRAIRGRPDGVRAYLGLGWSYCELGRTQEGIEAFKQAIRIKPDYAEAHYGLGWTYNKLNRWEEAIEAYNQGIRIKPDDAQAYGGLGWAYGKINRWEEAIEACKQGIRIKPDDANAHCNLGIAYGTLGRAHEAIVECTEAIRIKPDHANAHYILGTVYLALGHTQEAIEEHRQAIRIEPNHAMAHHNLGIAYLALGSTQEGIEEFKQAVRIKPDFALAHFNLGSVYLLQEEEQAALEEYKILRQLDRELAAKLFDLIHP